MQEPREFKTIEEQLDRLENRGVKVTDRAAAKRYLLSNNYYSVVNGYKSMFLDGEKSVAAHDDRYIDGMTFEQLVLIHSFDRLLRSETLLALIIAETRMKTAVVYAFCDEHRGCDDYLNPRCYCSMEEYGSSGYTRNLIRLLSTLQKVHDGGSGKSYIKHYIKEHDGVPLWVAAGSLTFGNISAFYDMQTRSVQNKTCKLLCEVVGKARIKPKRLRSVLSTLKDFRNICAHGERLFCAREGARGNLRYVDMFQALQVVLSEREFEEYVKVLRHLLKDLDDIPGLANKVLSEMGFNGEKLSSVRSDGAAQSNLAAIKERDTAKFKTHLKSSCASDVVAPSLKTNGNYDKLRAP